ncbi:MAG: hypothetical protein QF793_01780 [Candidatus Peribacteraceae bacterium]|jgi:hypothetical protein|nr:hypothetical protein [Candidatus Peribacteraceae bacterium]|tara:strand:+ start:57 stop:422 length:366 start_codon:yes stop_codon:yes gene_type:complete
MIDFLMEDPSSIDGYLGKKLVFHVAEALIVEKVVLMARELHMQRNLPSCDRLSEERNIWTMTSDISVRIARAAYSQIGNRPVKIDKMAEIINTLITSDETLKQIRDLIEGKDTMKTKKKKK